MRMRTRAVAQAISELLGEVRTRWRSVTPACKGTPSRRRTVRGPRALPPSSRAGPGAARSPGQNPSRPHA
eukprot:8975656-Pyramimonas_sp.AAC.1